MTLPADERAAVVDALMEAVGPDDGPPLDESWRAVVARRSDELASGAVAGVPWDEVRTRGRKGAGLGD